MNKFFSGAYGFELKLASGSKTVNFPDIPLLRDKRIKHIDVCAYSALEKTPTGNDLLQFGLPDLFVTLREQNTQQELIKSLPVSVLMPSLNAGARLYINKVLDQQNCYIDYSKLDVAYLDKYVYVVVYFDYPAMWGLVKDNNRTAILPLELKLKGKRTYFDENKELYRRSVQNILLSFPTLTPSGNDGLQNTAGKYVTLSYNNIEFISKLPLYLLKYGQFSFPLRFQNIKFDLQSSYIDTVTTTSDDLKSVFFNLICDDNK